jgi:phosphatidylserine/phosphatidylglycerophosphate/cardiolipin synthase-like enzyme
MAGTQYFVNYLPITTGNKLRLYIDGKDYCADLYDDLRRAKKFIFLTGLHFMAEFRLIRTGANSDYKTNISVVLGEAAQRGVEVFLLVNQFWKDEDEIRTGGGIAPIRHRIIKGGELMGYLPQTMRMFNLLAPFKNVHCRTDIHTNSDIFGTNHQKTVVIDDQVAFLGGIDLTFLDGDRWDTHDHTDEKLRAVDRTQKFWHDVHMRVEGLAVQFVRDNFIQRWTYGDLHILKQGQLIEAIPDKKHPPLPKFGAKPGSKYEYPVGEVPADTPTLQIVRSMPHKKNWHSEKPAWNRGKDDWERSCKEAYLIGIRSAKEYIYLENQWVADEGIWAELAAAAKRNNKNPNFRILVMVPYQGLFAAGLGSNQELFIGSEMEDVINNANSKDAFGMYSLVARWNRDGSADQIYIHSKILIVDDQWALIGSANAGGISLEGIRSGRDEPDTELSAIILDKKFAAKFRKALWEEHLGVTVNDAYLASDADKFREQAELTVGTLPRGWRKVHKVVYFPGYDNIRRGLATWSRKRPIPEEVFFEQFKRLSKIVPSYPDRDGSGVPPTLVRATFQAHVVPAPPAGYRLWYRWKCELFYDPLAQPPPKTINLKLLSVKNDKDEVWEYSDQSAVYIGKKTAEFIDAEINDIAPARIVCRVQVIPEGQKPDRTDESKSFLLQHNLTFMNAAFAKANHPDFQEYRPFKKKP